MKLLFIIIFIPTILFGQQTYKENVEFILNQSGIISELQSEIQYEISFCKSSYPQLKEESFWNRLQIQSTTILIDDFINNSVEIFKTYYTEQQLLELVTFMKSEIGIKYSDIIHIIIKQSPQIKTTIKQEINRIIIQELMK